MSLSEYVESYMFWDVVTLWARERLEHEEIVARALAKAVVCDGLVLNSVDPKLLKVRNGKLEFRGYPYVGYCATSGGEMMVLRADALENLLSIVRQAKTPSREELSEEFIVKPDFQRWLAWTSENLPEFWYGPQKQRIGA